MYNDEVIEIVKCPYDPSHLIRKFRFPYHILKCKKNHPNVELVPCRYDFNHLLKQEELPKHLETCPSKRRSESVWYKDELLGRASCAHETDEELEKEENDKFFVLKPLREWKKASERKADSSSVGPKTSSEVTSKTFKSPLQDFKSTVELKSNAKEEDDLLPLPRPKSTSKTFCFKTESHKKYMSE